QALFEAIHLGRRSRIAAPARQTPCVIFPPPLRRLPNRPPKQSLKSIHVQIPARIALTWEMGHLQILCHIEALENFIEHSRLSPPGKPLFCPSEGAAGKRLFW